MKRNKAKDKELLHALVEARNRYLASKGYTNRATAGFFVKILLLALLVGSCYVGFYMVSSSLSYFLLLTLYAVFSASLVLNIIHDASHGNIFKDKYKNDLLRNVSFFLVGNSPHLYKQEHVIEHHPVANVVGEDPGIIETPLLRFHEGQAHRSCHRYQHLYAPFLYSIHMTDFYVYSEFPRVFAFAKKTKNKNVLVWFFMSKLFHLSLLLALPMLFSSWGVLTIILGFLYIQMIYSWVMVYCLGTSHFNDMVPFHQEKEIADQRGWVSAQLETTVDYGVQNPLITAMLGGFNLHALHHILPGMSHVHLSEMIPVLEKLCKEYGYEYKHCSFLALLKSHFRLLKKMGNNEKIELSLNR